MLQLGWVVALSVLLPLIAGIWLDRQLGTAPLFVLVGALVGIIAGTIGATRVAMRTIEALGRPPEQTPDSGEKEEEDSAEKAIHRP